MTACAWTRSLRATVTRMTLVRLAGSGEALDEAGQRLVGLLGAQRAHVQGAVQVGAADAAELARLAHRGAGAVSLWREPDERGQRFGHERGDVGQLGQQDDRGDLTQSGNATQAGKIVGQHGIGGDDLACRGHQGLDLVVEPVEVRCDGPSHLGRDEPCLLTIAPLDASGLEDVAAAHQRAQMRGGWCPRRAAPLSRRPRADGVDGPRHRCAMSRVVRT